ncbi:chaperone NapD [Halomonas salifodinae]|uniref:chaperone NapD n=1 Tax=Halomonas salifodinae TaxID=438745 RepID=UPI0033AC94B3
MSEPIGDPRRENVLHIASLLVQARPQRLAEVAAWLGRRPGVELGAEDPAGKLVVVVESEAEAAILGLIDALQQRPGVLGAALIYHQVLDAASADQPQETLPCQ